MSQKEKSTKKSRASKSSAGEHGGGGKVFHAVPALLPVYKTDTKPAVGRRVKVSAREGTVNRRGLSDLSIVLMKPPGTRSRRMRLAGGYKTKGQKHELA
jgi:hypothetical protein